jgi:thiol:disulfide interchange protein DsbC
MKKIVAARKDIAFYIKLLPLKFHPDAYWKSKTMVCTKSTELLEDNFNRKEVPKPTCDTQAIDNNIKLAEELEITGTPTIVMPDGFVVTGAIGADTMTELVLKHLRKGHG